MFGQYMKYDEMLATVENSGGQDNPIYKALKSWTAEEIRYYDDCCSWCCYHTIEVVKDGFIMQKRCHKGRGSAYDTFYGDDGRVIKTPVNEDKAYVELRSPIEYLWAKADRGELTPDYEYD